MSRRRGWLGALLLIGGLWGCAGPASDSDVADLAPFVEADLARPTDLSAPADLTIGPVRTVTGFDAPAGAYWHAASDAWYVSNMAVADLSKLAVKDQRGWISKLDRDGKVLTARWFEAGLSTPMGLRSAGNQLVISDIDEVVLVDLTSRSAQRLAVAGAGLLTDVAAGADGTLYATDSAGGAVWSVKPGAAAQRVLSDTQLGRVSGVLALPNRLLLASAAVGSGAGALWSYTLDAGTLAPLGFSGALGGIEQDDMALLVADSPAARVYRVALGEAPLLVRDFQAQDGLKSGGDIGFDPARRLLAVPDPRGGSVAFVVIP